MAGPRLGPRAARLLDAGLALVAAGAIFAAVTLGGPVPVAPRELPAFFAVSLLTPLVAAATLQAALAPTLGLAAGLALAAWPRRRAWRLPLMTAVLLLWALHGSRLFVGYYGA